METERTYIINARVSFGCDDDCKITIGNKEQRFYQDGEDTIQEWNEGHDVNNIQSVHKVTHAESNYDIVAKKYFRELVGRAFDRIENLVVIMPIKRGFFDDFDFDGGTALTYPRKIRVQNLKIQKCRNGISLQYLLDSFAWRIGYLKIGQDCLCLNGIGSIENLIYAETLVVGQTDITDDELAKLRCDRIVLRSNNITENGIRMLMKTVFIDNDLISFEIQNSAISKFSTDFLSKEFIILEEYSTSTQYETISHFTVTTNSSGVTMYLSFSGNKISGEGYVKHRPEKDEKNWINLPNEIKLEVIKHMNLLARNCLRSCSKQDKILVDLVPFRNLKRVDIEFDLLWCKIEIDVGCVHKFTQIGDSSVQYERYELNKLINSVKIKVESSSDEDLPSDQLVPLDSFYKLAKKFFQTYLVQAGYSIDVLFFDSTLFPCFFESCGVRIKVRELTIYKLRGKENVETFLETIDPNLELLRIGSPSPLFGVIESHMCTAKRLIHRVKHIENFLTLLKNDFFEIIAYTYSETDINSFLLKVLSGNNHNLTGFKIAISNDISSGNRPIYEADLDKLFNGLEVEKVNLSLKFDEFGNPRRFPLRKDFRNCFILKMPKSQPVENELNQEKPTEKVEKLPDVEIRIIFYNCYLEAVVTIS